MFSQITSFTFRVDLRPVRGIKTHRGRCGVPGGHQLRRTPLGSYVVYEPPCPDCRHRTASVPARKR